MLLLGPDQRIEKVLPKGEERYRALFDCVPIGLYLTTPKGKLVEANEAMVQALGYPDREKLICVRAADLYADPEDSVRLNALIEQKGVVRCFETRIRRHDGAFIWASITAGAVRGKTGRLLYYCGAVEDITERMQAQMPVQEKEEYFQNLIENSSDIITVYDAEGIICYQSPSVERFLGYKPEEAVGKKRGSVIVIHPDDLAPSIHASQSAIKNPGVTFGPVEARIRHKDGTWQWFEAVYRAMVEKTGRMFIVINSRDVTYRKQALEALREGEEKYRGIFENSVMGIFQSTPKGRFITVNQALAHIHGFASPEEMLAEVINIGSQLFVTKEDRQRYVELFHQHAVVKNFVVQQYRKDRSKVWISISSKAVGDTNGNVLYYLGIVEDITQRKFAEEALRESEERFRLLFDNSIDGVIMSTPEGAILSANPVACRMLGRTEEEIRQVGRDGFVDVSDPRFAAAIEERNRTGEMRGEYFHIRKDGTRILCEVTAKVFYNKDGQSRISVILRDVTEQRRMEEELKRYRDFLENLSTTDGLTGIANRRKFDEFLDREWARAKRSQTTLSLILMDIDFFKAFNDNYGHLAGDDCLRRLAQSLAECVRRPVDIVARYGGEEFVCLLPDADADGAMLVAHHIQEKVISLNIPHAYSSVANHVTLSMGVATTIPALKQPSSDLIRRADELMYEAKRNGRNQVRS